MGSSGKVREKFGFLIPYYFCTDSVLVQSIFQNIKSLITKCDCLYFWGVFLIGQMVEFGKSSGKNRTR